MGWFWGSSNGNDPTKNLDPSLKDYLDKETPAAYTPTRDTSSLPQSSSHRSNTETSKSSSSPAEESSDKSTVPSASLFPDGRYAYLWKNYQPLEETEGPQESPTEKVVDQYKKRKDVLNEAALENCSEEHINLSTCFQTGDLQNKIRARMTMCADENRKFSRCYTMQAVWFFFIYFHIFQSSNLSLYSILWNFC